jgi:hypothetical protein
VQFIATDRIGLDYAGAEGGAKLLDNLSGVAVAGDLLWTVSDEGRTLECLSAEGGDYRLKRQYRLDEVIGGLPGRPDGAELDLEAVARDGDALWIAGSHCWVRRKPDDPDTLSPRIRDRPSRHVLARLMLDGDHIARADALPFTGPGSLRETLRGDAYLDRFLELPSKENGLDIEGLAVRGQQVLLGCRGPLLDSRAVVIELEIDADFDIAHYGLHFLDLDGLAVRDLSWRGEQVLVLAGPMDEAPGPFRLYDWRPGDPGPVEKAQRLVDFSTETEKPEGVCPLRRHGRDGLLVLYDSPDGRRIKGKRYSADWMDFP